MKVEFVPFGKALIDVIFEKIGNEEDLLKTCIVLPTRRAVFLLKQKFKMNRRPGIIPYIFSIDDFVSFLYRKKSFKKDADKNDLLLGIYAMSSNRIKKFFSIDAFLSVGTKFLNACESIDMALKDISREDVEGERGYIRFIPDIIKALKLFLEHYELTYRGDKYRHLAEKGVEIDFKTVLFAGINFSTIAEQKILKEIDRKTETIVFFQLDKRTSIQFGGDVVKNLKRNSKPEDFSHVKVFGFPDRQTEFASVANFLDKTDGKDTAIVLPEEDAIIPLLHSLSQTDNIFNITMGYPMKRNIFYHLIELFLEAVEFLNDNLIEKTYIVNIFTHPLIKNGLLDDRETNRIAAQSIVKQMRASYDNFIDISDCKMRFKNLFEQHIFESVKNILKAISNAKTIKDLTVIIKDFLLSIYNNKNLFVYPLNRTFFMNIISFLTKSEQGIFANEQYNTIVLIKIFKHLFEGERIAFKGEPFKGIQIMGALETRALAFKKIIVLDVNEGTIPASYSYDQVLPSYKRKELGIPDYKDRENITRLNFFSSILNAKEVFLLYTEEEESVRSRYIEQILWEQEKRGKGKEAKSIGMVLSLKKKDIVIEKTDDIINKMKKIRFSATKLDTFLSCSLKFYYAYILNLREIDEKKEASYKDVGNLVHKLMEEVYRRIVNKEIKNLSSLTKEVLERKFDTILLKEGIDSKKGEWYIIKQVVLKYLKNFIELEIGQKAENKIVGVETWFQTNIKGLNFVGRIDRIDKERDSYVVWDIKTKRNMYVPNINKFSPTMDKKSLKKAIHSLQLLLYLMFLYSDKKYRATSVKAGYISIFSRDKPYLYFESDKETIERIVLRVLEIIFEREPFVAEPSPDTCRICPFKNLCVQ